MYRCICIGLRKLAYTTTNKTWHFAVCASVASSVASVCSSAGQGQRFLRKGLEQPRPGAKTPSSFSSFRRGSSIQNKTVVGTKLCQDRLRTSVLTMAAVCSFVRLLVVCLSVCCMFVCSLARLFVCSCVYSLACLLACLLVRLCVSAGERAPQQEELSGHGSKLARAATLG